MSLLDIGEREGEGAPHTNAIRSQTASVVKPWPFGAALVGDGAEIGLPDELGVFGEEPALVTGCRGAPQRTARCQFALAGDQVHAPVCDVDAHPVAVADQRERAADRRLRRYM